MRLNDNSGHCASDGWLLDRETVTANDRHLYLLALEDAADAGVEGGSGEHGGDRVSEVQDLLEHGRHLLHKKF